MMLRFRLYILALMLGVTTIGGSSRAAGDPVLVGAGDIATCDSTGDEATARLLDGIDGTVFTTGDNAYNQGTAAEFAACYEPSWGRFKARTRPAPGNHEYETPGAAGYFSYFGARAGEPGKGYYSYDLGAWHIIVLNSNCAEVGGCAVGSPQERWLREDLAARRKVCTLAYWHHPRFSSGYDPNEPDTGAFWEALYKGGATLVLNGHGHHYERFAPQDPQGRYDPARGIREFIVGTGGGELTPFLATAPNSEVRDNQTFGVLELTLRPTSYDWRFVPVAGKTFSDAGTGACNVTYWVSLPRVERYRGRGPAGQVPVPRVV